MSKVKFVLQEEGKGKDYNPDAAKARLEVSRQQLKIAETNLQNLKTVFYNIALKCPSDQNYMGYVYPIYIQRILSEERPEKYTSEQYTKDRATIISFIENYIKSNELNVSLAADVSDARASLAAIPTVEAFNRALESYKSAKSENRLANHGDHHHTGKNVKDIFSLLEIRERAFVRNYMEADEEQEGEPQRKAEKESFKKLHLDKSESEIEKRFELLISRYSLEEDFKDHYESFLVYTDAVLHGFADDKDLEEAEKEYQNSEKELSEFCKNSKLPHNIDTLEKQAARHVTITNRDYKADKADIDDVSKMLTNTNISMTRPRDANTPAINTSLNQTNNLHKKSKTHDQNRNVPR